MGEGLSGFLGQFRLFDGYGYYNVPDKLTDVEEVYTGAYTESSDQEVDIESLYPFGCTGGLTLEINCPMGRVMHLYKFGHGLIIRYLQDQYLPIAIRRLETSREISLERATYLEAFLEGKLYTSEEVARKHVPLQLENARDIIRACKEARNGSKT